MESGPASPDLDVLPPGGAPGGGVEVADEGVSGSESGGENDMYMSASQSELQDADGNESEVAEENLSVSDREDPEEGAEGDPEGEEHGFQCMVS